MPRRDFNRRSRIARTFCAMGGRADDYARAWAMRQVAAWDRREADQEARELGYLELGGEAG